MSVQGPLVIPGPPLGPLDARVNFWTYVPTSLFLGALDVINPEMVLGQGVLSWVTGDEEMKTMLRKDGLRWTSGVKVSGGPKSAFIYDVRKIFRIFTPSPLSLSNSRNLTVLFDAFRVIPSPPPSADFICTWPPYRTSHSQRRSAHIQLILCCEETRPTNTATPSYYLL